MKKYRYIALLLLLPLLSACSSSQGEFDIAAFVKNPVISAIIVIVVLYVAFKGLKKK